MDIPTITEQDIKLLYDFHNEVNQVKDELEQIYVKAALLTDKLTNLHTKFFGLSGACQLLEWQRTHPNNITSNNIRGIDRPDRVVKAVPTVESIQL